MTDIVERLIEYNKDWRTRANSAKEVAEAVSEIGRLRRQTDKYGLALMMISQGVVDPISVADKALAKGWSCKACGWQGEMPNTKTLPDHMGTAQVPSCPDCDQHAALSLSNGER